MAKHLHTDLNHLKEQSLALAAEVEDSVRMAVKSLQERDPSLASRVIDYDHTIDKKEVALEEDCLKILALHQPVAIDLRLVVAILKLNNDLERIGDLAVNIAERAQFLSSREPVPIPMNFEGMAETARDMLRKALDALVNMDIKLAREVLAADDEVDAINREMFVQVQNGIREQPEQTECLIHLLSAARHLERVADHATNIAEDVIYMVDGEIVRHRAENYLAQRVTRPASSPIRN
jgi:phosphate transport system protein